MNQEFSNSIKINDNTNHKFNFVSIIITIFICIGVLSFIWFTRKCFGPCNHTWEYVSYKHNYRCTKCRELKSQTECIHSWEILKNNNNWFQQKCTKCGKFETEKRF